jgi:hypothetical protein
MYKFEVVLSAVFTPQQTVLLAATNLISSVGMPTGRPEDCAIQDCALDWPMNIITAITKRDTLRFISTSRE